MICLVSDVIPNRNMKCNRVDYHNNINNNNNNNP